MKNGPWVQIPYRIWTPTIEFAPGNSYSTGVHICDILVTIYELHYTILPICSGF